MNVDGADRGNLDEVNGALMRARAATAWQNDTGDIALCHLATSRSAPGRLKATVSAGAPAYLKRSIGEHSGIAAGPRDQIVSNRCVGTTAAVAAGELGFAALITGGHPSSVTAGSGYTARARTSSGSAFRKDILIGAAGTRHGTAALGSATDWYAVTATFHKVHNGSKPADLAGAPASAAGPQHAPFTLAVSTDRYAAVATFRPA